MTIKQLYSYLLLFEIQYLAKTMSSAKLQLKGLECYNCGGPNNLCSGKILCLIHGCYHLKNSFKASFTATEENYKTCFPNVTTCSVSKLKNKVTKEVTWGAGCGPEGLKLLSDYHCERLDLDQARGQICTCGQDYCNSRMGALEMMARAEFGVTGVGRHCYQCGGRGGRCRSGQDRGVGMDCGEGVDTCIMAHRGEFLQRHLHYSHISFSEDTGEYARGCGVAGTEMNIMKMTILT